MDYLLVFIGGGIGSIARFGIGNFIQLWWPLQFPAATIIVNILSSFILGFFIAWLALKPSVNDHYRLLIATGFCGGFSTLSTFTSEVFNLAKGGLFCHGNTEYTNQYYSLSCSIVVRNHDFQKLVADR